MIHILYTEILRSFDSFCSFGGHHSLKISHAHYPIISTAKPCNLFFLFFLYVRSVHITGALAPAVQAELNHAPSTQGTSLLLLSTAAYLLFSHYWAEPRPLHPWDQSAPPLHCCLSPLWSLLSCASCRGGGFICSNKEQLGNNSLWKNKVIYLLICTWSDVCWLCS